MDVRNSTTPLSILVHTDPHREARLASATHPVELPLSDSSFELLEESDADFEAACTAALERSQQGTSSLLKDALEASRVQPASTRIPYSVHGNRSAVLALREPPLTGLRFRTKVYITKDNGYHNYKVTQAVLSSSYDFSIVSQHIVDQLGYEVEPAAEPESLQTVDGRHLRLEATVLLNIMVAGISLFVRAFVSPQLAVHLILGRTDLRSFGTSYKLAAPGATTIVTACTRSTSRPNERYVVEADVPSQAPEIIPVSRSAYMRATRSARRTKQPVTAEQLPPHKIPAPPRRQRRQAR